MHPTEEKLPRIRDQERIGVCITNLGTPEAPDTKSVRRFLREFLSDPRVIEFPRLGWWFILNTVILTFRPSRSAALYQRVWSQRGSPLLVHTEAQCLAVAERLPQLEVVFGMRYGKPSIGSAIQELARRGVNRIIVLPLYPQYSATTTASTFDAFAQAFKRIRYLPEFHFVTAYYDDPGYIGALAESVRDAWSEIPRGERLLMSFHGIPARYAMAGDPYPDQCRITAEHLAEALGITEESWDIGYQSRVGREPWLQPYTAQTLKTWAKQGIKSVDVLCPGFSADCLETVDEIGFESKQLFLRAGGKSLRYIPALNHRPTHITALVNIIKRRITD